MTLHKTFHDIQNSGNIFRSSVFLKRDLVQSVYRMNGICVVQLIIAITLHYN